MAEIIEYFHDKINNKSYNDEIILNIVLCLPSNIQEHIIQY